MKRIVTALICVVFLFNIINSPFAQAADSDQLIRVKLASMGETQYMVVELNEGYQLKEDKTVALMDGSYQISYSIDGIKMIMPNGEIGTYKTITFQPLSNQSIAKMNNPSYGSCIYLNELSFLKTDKGIQVINRVNIEQYLYGVLPTMMNDDWETEALKAQAVAARTYATCSKRPLALYDVTDTEDNQAYLGYIPKQSNIVQAVNATQGEVLKYGTKYVEAYSTLSNGGKSESSEAVWQHILPYLVTKEDDYDLKHSDNQFASWTRKISKKEIAPYFAKRILDQCEEGLATKGYNVNDQNVTVKEIKAIDVLSQTESNRIKAVNVTVLIQINDEDSKKYLLDVMFSLDNESFKQVFNVVSERISIDESADAFVLYGAGYGHGVGLSRYGSDQMAKEGYKYEDILAYYYPLTYLYQMEIKTTDMMLPQIQEGKENTNPFDIIINKENPLFGYGTVVKEEGLDIRQGPGKQYEIIGKSVNQARVSVYEVEGDWLRVFDETTMGYVQAQFVEMDFPIDTQNKVPKKQTQIDDELIYDVLPPEDDKRMRIANWINQGKNSGPTTNNHLAGMGEVIWLIETINEEKDKNSQDQKEVVRHDLEKEEIKEIRQTTIAVCTDLLNVRKEANIDSDIMDQITGGTQLTAVAQKGRWLAIQYQQDIGFIDISYVEKVNIPIVLWGNTKNERAKVAANNTNLREYPNQDAYVTDQLNQGDMVEVLNEFGLWSYIKTGKNKGYIHNAYLIFEKTNI